MCMCSCVAVCAVKNNRHHFGKRTGVRHASSCRDPTSAPARAPASASQVFPKCSTKCSPKCSTKCSTKCFQKLPRAKYDPRRSRRDILLALTHTHGTSRWTLFLKMTKPDQKSPKYACPSQHGYTNVLQIRRFTTAKPRKKNRKQMAAILSQKRSRHGDFRTNFDASLFLVMVSFRHVPSTCIGIFRFRKQADVLVTNTPKSNQN